MWAKKPGSPNLTQYKNNSNTQGGITGHGNLYYTTDNNVPAVGRPSCDTTKTTCDTYAADWSGVTQLVAPGDVNGDGNADLITVEGNTAWFFHGGNTNGELLDPRLLTANLGPWRLIAPGNNDGTEAIEAGSDCDTGRTVPVSPSTPSDMVPAPKAIPDLWGLASTADGPIMSRSLHVSGYGCKETPLGDHNDVITLGPANQSTSTTGWGTTSRRLAATPGDGAGAGGLPDLYTIVHNNTTNRDELWCNEGTANADATGPHLSGRRIVDEGTSLNWANITNVA